jgi:hypothetical protein
VAEGETAHAEEAKQDGEGGQPFIDKDNATGKQPDAQRGAGEQTNFSATSFHNENNAAKLQWAAHGRQEDKRLFADYFDKGALAAAAVKFAVEDLLPRPEIEFAFGDGDDDFAAHDLAFEVRVGVVFPGAVVLILRDGFVGRQALQPDFIVVMEARLVVIDKNGGGDVHGVDQAEALLDAALAHEVLDLVGYVDEAAPVGDVEPEMLG